MFTLVFLLASLMVIDSASPLVFNETWSLDGDRGSILTAGSLKNHDSLFVLLEAEDVGSFPRKSWLGDVCSQEFQVLFLFRGSHEELNRFRSRYDFFGEIYFANPLILRIFDPGIRYYLHGARTNRFVLGSDWPSPEQIDRWFFSGLKNEGSIGRLLGNKWLRLQHHENDCGVAALLMLLAREGLILDEAQVYDGLNQGAVDAPISLLQIKYFLKSIGIFSDGWRGDYGNLASLRGPAILHVDGAHYVVFIKCFPSGVLILDPKLGRTFLTRDQLGSRWQGVYFKLDGERGF